MAISLVQAPTVVQGNGVSSVSLSFSSNTTAGNFVLVKAYAFKASTISFNTPTGGNTYALRGSPNNWTSTFRSICAVADAQNIAGGAETVTQTTSTTGDLALAIYEYSGLATAGAFDQVAYNQATSATPTSGSITTTQADALLVGSITHDTTTTTITPNASWTQRQEIEDATHCVMSDIDRVVGAIQTGLTHQWTLGSSHDCSMAIASYKAAIVGGAATAPLRSLLGVGT